MVPIKGMHKVSVVISNKSNLGKCQDLDAVALVKIKIPVNQVNSLKPPTEDKLNLHQF